MAPLPPTWITSKCQERGVKRAAHWLETVVKRFGSGRRDDPSDLPTPIVDDEALPVEFKVQ